MAVAGSARVAAALKKYAGRIAARALAGRPQTDSDEGMGKGLKVVLILTALSCTFLMIPLFLAITGPSTLLKTIFSMNDEEEVTIQDALDTDMDVDDIIDYMDEAQKLERYAQHTWNSGSGEDIYHLPTWRYLLAIDLAVSGNDLKLVSEHQDFYWNLHKQTLKATPQERFRQVASEKTDEGAYTVIDEKRYTADEYDALCAQIISAAEDAASAETKRQREEIVIPEKLDYQLRITEDGNTVSFWSGTRRISMQEYYGMLKNEQTRDAEIAEAQKLRDVINVDATYTLPEATWLRDEPYWIWCVTYKPIKSLFETSTRSVFSDEYRAIAHASGADYSTVLQNGGNAVGEYGLTFGEELNAFLEIASSYEALQTLAAWADEPDFEAGSEGFASDWKTAIDDNYQIMILAQDSAWKMLYADPAHTLAERCSIDYENLHDATKALLAVWVRYLGKDETCAILDEEMQRKDYEGRWTDQGIVRTLSHYAATHDFDSATFLWRICLLASQYSQDSASPTFTVTAYYIGDDHEAQSGTITTANKAILATRYNSILRSVNVSTSWYLGIKSIDFDYDEFKRLAVKGFSSESDLVETAIALSEDDSHGYSQSGSLDGGAGRFLDPDVDCSSFVYYCLRQIGYSTDQLGTAPFTTRTMGKVLVSAGYEELDFTGFDDCEYGDILVRGGDHAHTEIVSGSWQTVGAHDNYDGVPGDSSGNEVSVIDRYSEQDWYGAKVYRLIAENDQETQEEQDPER